MAKAKKTTKQTRIIRPYEERLAEIEKKIKFHENAIQTLKNRKEKMQNPPLSKDEKKSILTTAVQSGFTPEEIAEILEKAKKEKEENQ